MMTYWTNFAKTGDPNGAGMPAWPKYGADDALIHLNSPITSGPDATASALRVPVEGNSADALLIELEALAKKGRQMAAFSN